jgi:hypothetical protein
VTLNSSSLRRMQEHSRTSQHLQAETDLIASCYHTAQRRISVFGVEFSAEPAVPTPRRCRTSIFPPHLSLYPHKRYICLGQHTENLVLVGCRILCTQLYRMSERMKPALRGTNVLAKGYSSSLNETPETFPNKTQLVHNQCA